MPRKIRELISDLKRAGFKQTKGGGKGSHKKFKHKSRKAPVILAGKEGADAKSYQEKDVREAIDEVS